MFKLFYVFNKVAAIILNGSGTLTADERSRSWSGSVGEECTKDEELKTLLGQASSATMDLSLRKNAIIAFRYNVFILATREAVAQ